MRVLAGYGRVLGWAWVACMLVAGAPAAQESDVSGDVELELIPAPPGAADSAQSSSETTGAADRSSVVGISALTEGLSLPSDLKIVTRTPGSISAPAYLTAIAGNRSVLLSWYQSEGPRPISGYLVYRGTDPGRLDPQPLNREPISETNFSDSDVNSRTGPLNGVEYWYRVRAFDVEGRLSPYSDLVSARPSGPLLPPARLEAEAGNGKVVLSWPEPLSTGDNPLAGFILLKGSDSGRLQPFRKLGPEARSFTDTPLPNGTPVFYAIVAIDALGNTSPASPERRAVPYVPLSAPVGLSALGVGDAAVRLRWNPPAPGGSFKIKGYNIYRSTGPFVDLTSPPINKGLIPDGRTRFEDGPEDSTDPPKLGTNYTYRVVAVDAEGNPSPPSAPSTAGPVASLTNLSPGEFEVTQGNTLQIQGRKTINASNTWRIYSRASDANSGQPSSFALDQQLQVRLTGKVGRKIKVDVDYDDKAVGSQQQKISVVYTGDQQEVFKEFAFGDIQMDLNSPRTQFAGYNKSLFGAKVKLLSPDERLQITAVGAQTKGVTESKRILGGYEQARTNNILGEDKQDLSFQPYKFYYLSREKELVEGPDFVVPGSVEIWIDQPNITIFQPGRVTVPFKDGTGSFNFVRLAPNVDYLVDYDTGLITFNRAIGQNDSIAVAYRVQKSDGSTVSVGYAADGSFDFTPANLDSDKTTGKTSNAFKLIQFGFKNGNSQYDSHMSMQYYRLNGRDILNPQLDPDFKLIIYNANQVPIYQLDPRSDFSDVVRFDLRQGWMAFRVPFPFKSTTTDANGLRMSPNFHEVEEAFSPDQNDAYNRDPAKRTNRFTIHVEYKYKVQSYSLRWGIIRNSEVILLNGRRLVPNVDYYLDYDSGSLVFSNPDLIKEDSVIDATYEYIPGLGFGASAFTSTIWGARGQYDLTKDISIGSTFLWNSADAPTEVPDVRSGPFSLQVLDGDIQVKVPQPLLDGITKRLPLLPKNDELLKVTLNGELAHSWYKPNNYGRNNESGVAMIDSFEALENIVSTSNERTSWFPASRPLRFNGDVGLLPQDRRFTRFTTVTERASDARSSENPNRSMARIEWVGFNSPENWDAYVYPFGQFSPDAIRNASYLEIWVKPQNKVTLHVDVGIINEDATDNGNLDTESVTGVLAQSQDIGILNERTILSPYFTPQQRPDLYADPGYWGRGNNSVDTEDINGDGVLNTENRYYSYSRVVDPADPRVDPNSGFLRLQIPLTEGSTIGTDLSTVPGNVNYFPNTRAVRIWINNAATPSGTLTIESIKFKGNKWQVRADPNVVTLGGVSATADTSKFDVTAISRYGQEANPVFPYVPNNDFFNLSTNKNDDREQSLQIEYALTRLEQNNGQPYYQARKLLANGQAIDVGIYQKLRMDLFIPGPLLPGERILLRLGSDDQNYFEYSMPLDGLAVGSWNRLTFAVDGSDGLRIVYGKPYLRQIRYVALAVHTLNDNLNPDPRYKDHKELLWVNNLRLTDAITREGGAQRVTTRYDLMGGALTVDHQLQDVDSDFVKMDRQADAPQRHDRTQSLDANLRALAGVALNVRYEQREQFSEPLRKDDPIYNRSFVDPDESSYQTSARLSFSRIQGLNMNTSFNQSYRRQLVLPTYVEQLKSSNTIEPFVVPNTRRDDLSVNQDLNLRMPEAWWILGGDDLRLEAGYTSANIIFDRQSAIATSLYRNTQQWTRTLKGRYSGSYKAGSWLTISPGYAFTLAEARGNIAVPTLPNGQAYYDLGTFRFSDAWVPQSRVLNPSLQLQFTDLYLLRAPKLIYNFTQTRDFVRNDLRTPGSLSLNTALNLGALGSGFEKFPALDFNQTFSVDSVVNNDVRVRGAERSRTLQAWLDAHPEFASRYAGAMDPKLSNIALQEQQSPLQSVWWVRLEDLGLGENVADPLNIENLAMSASRRSNTSISTRFDLPLLPAWTGTFSPRLTLLDDRTMSAPEQVLRRKQTTVGSGLEFREPHIPYWKILKPSALMIDYSYSSSESYVVQILSQFLNSTSAQQNLNLTLPMRPSDRMALTLSLRWSGTDESNYVVGVKAPTSGRSSWELGPALKLVYFLDVNKTYKLWDLWPFYGRELRVKQNFRLDNDFNIVMRRDKQNLTTANLPETGTDIYGLRNQIGYNVLDNVKMNFIVDQQYYHNVQGEQAINRTGDYYQIKLELGLEATF
jgi:hypothetical protein